MSKEISIRQKSSYRERRKHERRQLIRRTADKAREQAVCERARKLQSLVELGQLIGLDLQINEILLQVAQKACEVMEADRGSLFLYDPKTNELWSTVALGMGGQVIRIPSGVGIAGYCFKTGETINLGDAYSDPRFNKEVDAHTGYHTRTLICMPLYNRSGESLGVIQLLNKKDGVFNQEDETFLRTFGNHAAVFIEMAQLQKARIDALEESRRELERLNKVKSKALHHLSHELRTPLSVIQGNIRILKRKLQTQISLPKGEGFFEILEKHLNRLIDIQQETERIIRSHQDLDERISLDQFDQLFLFPFSEKILTKVRDFVVHRNLYFQLEGKRDLWVQMDPRILEDILVALLKNAIENTPDEGMIRILLEQKGQRVLIKVQDFGIGINEENQKSLFDGLFHTQETELYTSKKAYDFNAGGKGLDLLQIKVFGQRFGFNLSVESQRCIYLPTDLDLCAGKISACPHCQGPEDCFSSGGSTFSISFPIT